MPIFEAGRSLPALKLSLAEIGDLSPLVWSAKLAGAFAGSLISLAYIVPRGRREAALRLAIGLVTGIVFGGTAGVKIADFLGLLGKLSVLETTMMGASFASLMAWWALGALRNLVERRVPAALDFRSSGKPPASQSKPANETKETGS